MFAKRNRNNKKTPTFFHLTRVTLGGGGGQDGKWSHFPPLFFFNPSLRVVDQNVGDKSRAAKFLFQINLET